MSFFPLSSNVSLSLSQKKKKTQRLPLSSLTGKVVPCSVVPVGRLERKVHRRVGVVLAVVGEDGPGVGARALGGLDL